MKNEDPALSKARQELEALKKPQAPATEKVEAPVAENAPAATPTPEPAPQTPEPAATPDPQVDELRRQLAERDAKIADLTKRVNTEDGRHGRELQHLREANQQLLHELKTVQERLVKVEEARAEPVKAKLPRIDDLQDVLVGIPKEDLEAYDEKALALMAMMARNAARAKKPEVSEQDIAQVRESVKRTEEQARYESYVNAVDALAPGFRKANGHSAAGVQADPAWLEFLAKPVNPDLSPESWGEYANRVGTADVAAKVFQRFTQEKSGTPPAAAPKQDERPTLAGQVAPSKVAGGSKPPAGPETFKRAEFEAIQREAARPGGLANAEVRKKWETLLRAAVEGRLVD